jgi:DNA-directed RNA polymerase II subunit RPB1
MDIYYNEDITEIKKIKFCIYTNANIKKYSVVADEIYGIDLAESRVNSNNNNEPKVGGLLDLRLGSTDMFYPCATCGDTECPGHFGHTVLAEHVFHYGFLTHLRNILSCICLKCSKLLVDKTDIYFKKSSNKKAEIRYKEIKNLTKNVNICFYCGWPVYKIKRDEKDNGSIKIIIERTINQEENNNIYQKKIKEIFTPRDCYSILRNISDEECFILGFNPKIQRPEDMIIKNFPIPPVLIRPTAKMDFLSAATMEDSLTLKIADIINANKRVRQLKEKETIITESNGLYNQDIFTLLQYHIINIYNNDVINLPKTEFKTGGIIPKCIKERIEGKYGIVRCNLMGKRVDFSGRTVITPDPYVDIDELGVPIRIAKELTIPEEVTPQNKKYLTQLVENGRLIYPGANYVFKVYYKDNKEYLQKIDLFHRKKSLILNIGDIVERHIINGDYVLFNRQPTLHKPSMMGHRVQVINNPKLETFRMNISVCGPYNADFDGDEMNIHLPQSYQARNEIKRIANVKFQIVGIKNSSPIIGCQNDTLSGAYMLTQDGIKLKGNIVANILACTTSERKKDIDMNKIYTGHEIFSFIIPKGINISKKGLIIVDGNLIKGHLDSSLLSSSKNSIIHYIWDKFGPDKTRKFIDDSQRLILKFLLYKGQTCGFQDTKCDNDIYNQMQLIISNEILESKYNITQFENSNIPLPLDIIEKKLFDHLKNIQTNIGQILMSYLDNTNFFYVANKSGAKGGLSYTAQILGVIGQTVLEGTRFKKKVEGRSLFYFHKDDDTPEARGFIKNTYLSGLSLYEYYYNIAASREGLIDTAIKTATSGYITRQLVKNLEDLIVKYDGTTRNAKDIIVQMVYGENGINQSKQSEIKFNIITMNNKMIEEKFKFTKDQLKLLKIDETFNNNYILKMIKYRNNIRIIQNNSLLKYKILEEYFMIPVNLIRITEYYKSTKKNIYDLSPYYIIERIENFLDDPSCNLINIKSLIKENRKIKYLLEIGLYEYLAPNRCIFEYNLDKNSFDKLMNEIKLNFIKAIIEPGEMVGVLAAQTIGEPTTQFSCSGDTKIKILQKNKITNSISIDTYEISFLIDKLINDNPNLTFNTGHLNSLETNITSLENEFYIIGVDKFEKTSWNKISHISRHPTNGNMMKVITKSGRKVKTTTSHSHLVRKNQTVVPIVGKELKVGMRIPTCKFIKNITKVKDFIEIDNTGVNYKLDFLFGWFIGAYLGCGLIQNNYIHIKNNSEYYINNCKIFAERFNESINYENNTIIIKIDSLIKYLITNNIPNFAFDSPIEFKIGLLQSYFDSSNHFYHGIQCNKICACSSNEDLILDISLLLNYFNIITSINENYIKYTKIYNLEISSKNLLQYKKKIGSNIFNDILDKMIEFYNGNEKFDDIDEINDLDHIIEKCINTLSLNLSFDNNNVINRELLIEYINIFQSHEDNYKILHEINILNQAAYSDIIWDEVVNIEIYEPFNEYVYDFTVPNNETFMINNGIIIHNTLNTKHFAGISGKGSANMGLGRIQELLHYSKNIKTPQMTIYFKEPYSNNRTQLNKIISHFKFLSLKELTSLVEIYYDTNNSRSNPNIYDEILIKDKVSNPFFINNLKTDLFSLPLVFRFKMNIEKMLDKEITLLDIKTKFITYWYNNFNNIKMLKKNDKEIISKISRCAILSNNITDKEQIIHIRFNMISFNYDIITDFLRLVLEDIKFKGINNIDNIVDITEERLIKIDDQTGDIKIDKEFVTITEGINIEALKTIKGIDFTRTTCNDIYTILRLYGIEAARQILLYEIDLGFQSGGSTINRTHLSLLVDQMTYLGEIISIDRHGMDKIDLDPLAKASFEKTMNHFINASIFNETDHLKSISSRIMVGKVINGGTGAFDLLLDTKKIEKSEYTTDEFSGRITFTPLNEESLIKDIIKYYNNSINFFIPSNL